MTVQVVKDPREGMDDYNSPEAMDAFWEKVGWDGAPNYPMLFDRVVQSVPVGSRVLDLGCGPGKLLQRLKRQRNCIVKGVDHSQKAADIALEHGVMVDVTDILDYEPLYGEGYDVVIATEVLEHLDEPEKFLARCKALTRTGGLMFFSVPNDAIGPEQDKSHKRTYTIDEFGKMLEGVSGQPLELFVGHDRMVATCGKADYESYEPKITVPLMLKNEEKTVRKALDSIKDIAGEIHVWIDDKSTDKTEEICREYTDQIFHFTWNSDFAEIRNKQIEKANHDWILVLDGHEYVKPKGVKYLQGVADIAPYVVSIRGKVIMDKTKDGTPGYFFYQPRLFRNYWDCHWVSPVHNALRVPFGRDAWVSKFEVQHERGLERALERSEQRNEMNKPHLLKRLAKNEKDVGALFYLGLQAQSESNLEEACDYFKRHLACCDRRHERGQSAINYAVTCYQMGDKKKCKELLFEYLCDMWHRPEAYGMLASIAKENNKMEEARHWANVSAHTRPLQDPFFMSYPAHTYLPYEQLMEVYDASGDFDSAIKCARKVLEYKDDPKLLKRVEETEEYLNERGRGNGD